jgi:hypothetical protein
VFQEDGYNTARKVQRLRLVPLMQHESILYVTDTKSIGSLFAYFHTLSAPATLEYVEYAGMCISLLKAYSRMPT